MPSKKVTLYRLEHKDSGHGPFNHEYRDYREEDRIANLLVAEGGPYLKNWESDGIFMREDREPDPNYTMLDEMKSLQYNVPVARLIPHNGTYLSAFTSRKALLKYVKPE